jgi:hypothetical protein
VKTRYSQSLERGAGKRYVLCSHLLSSSQVDVAGSSRFLWGQHHQTWDSGYTLDAPVSIAAKTGPFGRVKRSQRMGYAMAISWPEKAVGIAGCYLESFFGA